MNKRCRVESFLVLIASCLVLTQTGCDAGLSHVASYNYLLLELNSDRSQAKVDEPVQIRFTIRNTGQQLAVVESSTAPVMDIVVQLAGGHDLLTWSSQNPDKVAHRLEWKPGEVKVIKWVWIPREEDIASGYYKNVALVGRLSNGSKSVQNASVVVCASNFCK